MTITLPSYVEINFIARINIVVTLALLGYCFSLVGNKFFYCLVKGRSVEMMTHFSDL